MDAVPAHTDPLSGEEEEESEWEYEYHPIDRETHYITLNLPSTNPLPSRKRRRVSSSADEKIQILGLHTNKPIISYRKQAYECNWNAAIGTDIIFAPPASTDSELQRPSSLDGKEEDVVPMLETDKFSLITTTRVKISGTPVKILPNMNKSLGGVKESPQQYPQIPIPLSDAATTSHRRQAKFLATLAGIKRARGEEDKVFIGLGYWDGREELRERQEFEKAKAKAIEEGRPSPVWTEKKKKRPGRKPKIPKGEVVGPFVFEGPENVEQEEEVQGREPSKWGGLPPGLILEDELDSDPDDWAKNTGRARENEEGTLDFTAFEESESVFDRSNWEERPGKRRKKGASLRNERRDVDVDARNIENEDADEDSEDDEDEDSDVEIASPEETPKWPRMQTQVKPNEGFSSLGGGMFRDLYEAAGTLEGSAGLGEKETDNGFTHEEAPATHSSNYEWDVDMNDFEDDSEEDDEDDEDEDELHDEEGED